MKKAKKVIREEVKNFFIYNKGKLFCLFMAISIIVTIINPFTDNIISTFRLHNPYSDSEVKIVDISVSEDILLPVIDIKLRNTGQAVAYINKMEIIMKDFTILNNIYGEDKINSLNSKIEYEGLYDIMLTSDELQSYSLSQKIPGNDVDRFALTVYTADEIQERSTICTFKIKLYYNEDNQCIESDYITLVTDYRGSFYYKKYSDYANKEFSIQNYNNLSRINKYKSVKSDEFQKLYKSYKNHRDDFLKK